MPKSTVAPSDELTAQDIFDCIKDMEERDARLRDDPLVFRGFPCSRECFEANFGRPWLAWADRNYPELIRH